ncbi:lipopolysaccharide biosynthesis protein [Comamonas terrae]|uniref:Lipopolysaccharide biosynthesis protein n=1 Tax=Comamonas terrae TaxID=673548 RepID=A0ABW5UP72_9BURK|nr:oligosaccharide flippase family protein [Comamonas terrae]
MLIRHIASYFIARGIPGIINFIALAIYTRILSSDEFGRYSTVMACIGVFHVLIFQWLILVCARFLPKYPNSPKKILEPVLAIFLLLTGIIISLSLIGMTVGKFRQWHMLIPIAVVLTIVQAWHELNLQQATTLLDPRRYGALSGIKSILALTSGALLAYYGFAENAPLIGLIIGSATSWMLVGRSAWAGVLPRRPTSPQWTEFGSYGLPLAITFSLIWITSSSDRLMITYFLGEAQTGLYSVGYDLAQNSLGLLLIIINTAATPLVIKVFESRGVQAASLQMRQNGELIFAMAFSGAAGLIAIAPGMIGIFAGEKFREGALPVFIWIALSAAVVGIKSYYFDIVFHLTKKTKWLLITNGIAAIFNVGINYYIIPIYGIVGAAWASGISYLIATVGSAVVGMRYFPMPKVISLVGIGLVPATATYFSASLCMSINIPMIYRMSISILMGGFVVMLIFFLLNIANSRYLLMGALEKKNGNGGF